jgi:hypothetical protein
MRRNPVINQKRKSKNDKLTGRRERGKKRPVFNRDSRENRNKKIKNRFRTGPRMERV